MSEDGEKKPRGGGLINRSACKKLALAFARDTRGRRFTRVSAGFLDDVEMAVRNRIEGLVRSHPSVGKTLMGG